MLPKIIFQKISKIDFNRRITITQIDRIKLAPKN